MQTKKECISCHKRKPLDYFYRTKANKVGASCLQCQSQHDLNSGEVWFWNSNTPNEVHRYAITLEFYKYLRALEPKGCFACGQINKNGRKLYIDHDHKTGRVRGLLCAKCNVKLGKLRDNPPAHSRLSVYLAKALPVPIKRNRRK